MDGLFSVVWIVFIVFTLVNAVTGKNKKNQKKQTSIPPMTASPMEPSKDKLTVRELEKMVREQTKAAKANPAPASAKTMLPPQPVAQPAPMAPRVHTHLSMDCDQDDPSGSMDFISTEGVDPCHDDELPSRTAPRSSLPVMQEQPGLALEWTSDALVKSVIMQEILTRPSQRRR